MVGELERSGVGRARESARKCGVVFVGDDVKNGKRASVWLEQEGLFTFDMAQAPCRVY